MADLNDRISDVIEALGIKKVAFAEKLNVSQAFVSQLCAGVKQPSDRTILDICREFNVNEQWLRTGEGEMFIPVSRDDEIEIFIGNMLRDEDNRFKKRLISALARLSEREWEVLEEKLKEIVGVDEKKRADYLSPRSARI